MAMLRMAGSTTLTVTGSGAKYAEQRYYPWGDTRYTYWKTPTAYQFTGQYHVIYTKMPRGLTCRGTTVGLIADHLPATLPMGSLVSALPGWQTRSGDRP